MGYEYELLGSVNGRLGDKKKRMKQKKEKKSSVAVSRCRRPVTYVRRVRHEREERWRLCGKHCIEEVNNVKNVHRGSINK